MASIAARKQALVNWIQGLEDSDAIKLLEKIRSAVETYRQGLNEDAVGYSASGKPLTKDDIIRMIALAEEEVESGQFIDFEALKQEAKNW